MNTTFCILLLFSIIYLSKSNMPEQSDSVKNSLESKETYHDDILKNNPNHRIAQELQKPIPSSAEENGGPLLPKSDKKQDEGETADDTVDNLYPVIEDEYINFVYILPSRSKQCFYYTPAGTFSLDFMVSSGGSRLINVYVNNADGGTLVDFINRKRGEIKVQISKEQYYKNVIICLDNRQSTSDDKLIDFKIEMSHSAKLRFRLSHYGHAYDMNHINYTKLEDLITRDIFLMKTDKIDQRLSDIVQQLRMWRLLESQDILLAEFNWSHVTFWSMIQLLVMLFVGLVQVFLIRSIFDEKSMFHKIWKKQV